jgi:hypothetical protein
MTRWLLVVGVLLVALGASLLGGVLVNRTDPAGAGPTPMVMEAQEDTSAPSRWWPVAGGLSLAAGAAAIGLSLNRWKAGGAK